MNQILRPQVQQHRGSGAGQDALSGLILILLLLLMGVAESRAADFEFSTNARWIGNGPAQEPRPAPGVLTNVSQLTNLTQRIAYEQGSRLLRRAFQISKPVRRATARVTGLGYFEFHCNGQKVGDHVLAPVHGNYRKTVLYETIDLTHLLRPGTNVLGMMLGNGWFNPPPKWWDPYRMPWFGSKRGIAQLEVDYDDGSVEEVFSDPSWRTAPGPVTSSCVFDGETCDATLYQPGWDDAGFDDSGWAAARVMESPGGLLEPRRTPPIRVIEHLIPSRITEPQPGRHVVDFGQNFAGWVRLMVSGPRGTRITLRHAEDLKPDGMIDVTSNEHAEATDVYILRGGGVETWEPRFTFHGFRYVEITGFPGLLKTENILGCVVHSDCALTGDFECDNDLINRIHRATVWSQRGNLMGYPMDCPQRDERLGWFGDAMVTMEEAMFNFDMADFYRNWLADVRSSQSGETGDISILSPRPYMSDEPDPTWSSAYPVMLWQFYVHQGDRRILEEHFDAMCRFVDFLGTQAKGHILPKYWIGDWGTTVKGWKEGEPVSVVTAFYYYDTLIVARAAKVLGREAEAARYEALAGKIKKAFNAAWFDPGKGNYEQGTQFGNAFPLLLGLEPAGTAEGLLRNILADIGRHEGHFTVGVLGAKYLMDTLSANGRSDAAYKLVNQTGFPGWAHLLEGGKTTLSEFWDLHGSHNHVMLGSVDGWFYRVLAGIEVDPEHPGFEHFTVRPFLAEGLNWVRAGTRTVRGRAEVEWRRHGPEFELGVTVPPGSRATIVLPDDYVRTGSGPGGSKVRAANRAKKGNSTLEIGPGHHIIHARRIR